MGAQATYFVSLSLSLSMGSWAMDSVSSSRCSLFDPRNGKGGPRSCARQFLRHPHAPHNTTPQTTTLLSHLSNTSLFFVLLLCFCVSLSLLVPFLVHSLLPFTGLHKRKQTTIDTLYTTLHSSLALVHSFTPFLLLLLLSFLAPTFSFFFSALPYDTCCLLSILSFSLRLLCLLSHCVLVLFFSLFLFASLQYFLLHPSSVLPSRGTEVSLC